MRPIFVFICALIAITSLPAFAQSFAVVDEQLFENAKAIQDVKRQIDEKREAFQAEVNEKESELVARDEALAKERDLISKEAFDEKAKAFRAQFVEAQQLLELRRNQLEKANIEATSKIRTEIEAIIAELAAEKGFDVAISRSRLLYANDSLDISADVLAELDKRMPTVELTVDDIE